MTPCCYCQERSDIVFQDQYMCSECFRGVETRLHFIADMGHAPGHGRLAPHEQIVAREAELPAMPYRDLHTGRVQFLSRYRGAERRRSMATILPGPLPPGIVRHGSLVFDAARDCYRHLGVMKRRCWRNTTADCFAVRFHEDFVSMPRLVREIFDLCEKKENKYDFPVAQITDVLPVSEDGLKLMMLVRPYFQHCTCFGGRMAGFDALLETRLQVMLNTARDQTSSVRFQ